MPTLQELLDALNAQNLPGLPPPARPLPLGPLQPQGPTGMNLTSQPDVAPQAPLPGANRAFIDQYTGAAPTPPTPPTKLQRIANMLIGFGEGAAGRGSEFLYQLQEPQREYQRAQERYAGRRAEAIQIDEQRRQRQMELTQRRADEQSDREFKTWMQRTGVSDQLAIERLQESHAIEREARRQRYETERALEAEQR